MYRQHSVQQQQASKGKQAQEVRVGSRADRNRQAIAQRRPMGRDINYYWRTKLLAQHEREAYEDRSSDHCEGDACRGVWECGCGCEGEKVWNRGDRRQYRQPASHHPQPTSCRPATSNTQPNHEPNKPASSSSRPQAAISNGLDAPHDSPIASGMLRATGTPKSPVSCPAAAEPTSVWLGSEALYGGERVGDGGGDGDCGGCGEGNGVGGGEGAQTWKMILLRAQ